MAKKITQFRYYGESHSQNYPNENWISNKDIFNNYFPIISLGVQSSIPGIKFYVNDSDNPIVIGANGIYELDLTGLSEIHSLRFSQESIELIKSGSHYLIVDFLYEGEGGITE